MTERRGHADRQVVIHSLRHTFATTLIRREVNVKTVSILLGHSTIGQTLQTYAHVLEGDREAAIAALPFGTRGSMVAACLEAAPQLTKNTGT